MAERVRRWRARSGNGGLRSSAALGGEFLPRQLPPWRSSAPDSKKARFPGPFLLFKSKEDLERVKRFERSTPTLARLCSTPELHPLTRPWAASRAYMAEERGDCNREMTGFLVAANCLAEPRRPRWWLTSRMTVLSRRHHWP